MTIYFIQNLVTLNVKVGYTNRDPIGRLKNLQTSCCAELRLLIHFPGSVSLETQIHHKCKDYRVLNEWFKPEFVIAHQCFIKDVLGDRSDELDMLIDNLFVSSLNSNKDKIRVLERHLAEALNKIEELNRRTQWLEGEVNYWHDVSVLASKGFDIPKRPVIPIRRELTQPRVAKRKNKIDKNLLKVREMLKLIEDYDHNQ